jgi:glycosyltransferase involved in cell wall biosynthesis
MLPKVLILMCTHNGEAFVREQIVSCLKQGVLVSDLVIFDWNSTDSTRQIILEEARKDNRIELVTKSTAPGPGNSFMAAIRELINSQYKFDYLALCDQDDIWIEQKIERQVQHMLQHKDKILICSDVILIDENGDDLRGQCGQYGPKSYFSPRFNTLMQDESIILTNPCIGMTMLLPRSLVRKVASVVVSDNIYMHDWAICVVALLCDFKLFINDAVMVKYRQHPKNILGSKQKSLATAFANSTKHYDKVFRQYEIVENSLGGNLYLKQKFWWLVGIVIRSRLLSSRGKIFNLLGLSYYFLQKNVRLKN